MTHVYSAESSFRVNTMMYGRQKFYPTSMKNRIILLVFICVVVSTSILGAQTYLHVRETTRRQAIDRIAAKTELVAARFNRSYSDIARDLHTVAETQPVMGLGRALKNGGIDLSGGNTIELWRERLESVLAAIMRGHREYSQFSLIMANDEGMELVRVNRSDRFGIRHASLNKLQQKGNEAYFRKGLSAPLGIVTFSEASHSRELGKVMKDKTPMIRAILPVADTDGEVFALLVINIDYEQLMKIAFTNLAPENSVIALNSAGDYMVHRPFSKPDDLKLVLRNETNLPPPPIVKKVLSLSVRTGILEMDGVTAYFRRDASEQEYHGTNMGFILEVDSDELYAEAIDIRDHVIFMCVMTTAFFAFLSSIAASRFMDPLNRLARLVATSQIGELIPRLPLDREDEVGALARALEHRSRALYASQERARTIVENVMDGLLLLREDGTIESFNPACERIFGYAEKDVLDRRIDMLLPEGACKGPGCLFETALKNTSDNTTDALVEMEVRTRSGALVPVEVGLQELDFHGVKKFGAVIRDISERREIERLRAEFIATVSHELRTPLTSIRGSLVLLDRMLSTNEPEKVKRMVEMALKNTGRLILLVNDILDFEKLQANKTTFNIDAIDATAAIGKAVDMNQSYAQDRHVTLRAYAPPTPLLMACDEERLQQVMANLLSNAAKYSHENGTVEIRASRNDGSVRIEIIDHGSGIPADFQDKIFDPFSQANNETSRRKGGTGLGLNITKRLAEGMDGKIGFTSTEGKGSTFWVEFPEVEARPEKAPLPLLPHQLRGLHLEDDRDFSEVLQVGLESDIRLINETTLEGAREQLRKQDFDIVIIDIALREGNGLDLIQHIPDPDKTLIVVVSALDAPIDNPYVDLAIVKSRQPSGGILTDILDLVKRRAAVPASEPLKLANGT